MDLNSFISIAIALFAVDFTVKSVNLSLLSVFKSLHLFFKLFIIFLCIFILWPIILLNFLEVYFIHHGVFFHLKFSLIAKKNVFFEPWTYVNLFHVHSFNISFPFFPAQSKCLVFYFHGDISSVELMCYFYLSLIVNEIVISCV